MFKRFIFIKIIALIIALLFTISTNVYAVVPGYDSNKTIEQANLADDVFTLQTKIDIKNNSNNTINNVKVNLSLLGIDDSFQELLKEEFSKKPTQIGEKQYHARVATFSFDSLEPKQTKTLVIENVINIHSKNNGIVEEDILEYLEPANKIESDHPDIIKQAQALTNNLDNDYEKAKSIYAFVRDNINYDLQSPYRNKGALSAFVTQEGVCEEYASLFVALCRASEIPARIVNGFADPKANGETWNKSANEALSLNQYRHSWAEFYTEDKGWLPADPTFDSPNKGMKYFGSIPYPSHIAQNYHDLPLQLSYQGPRGLPLEVNWDNKMIFNKFVN
ncbi:transglutaminase-like domain-containing protein [Candidatus Syntrophocurvum alkaliphilum]|uniref:transglutaminase-like domain-containing protein n=1 Tax=Candidatus Syntrophocurvum alkaliphilum TaxID=2293317 RepID=UPI0018CD656E|nr:transglutaminase-like domain-containing protein [Candidatus Syntrophocurvum alkaliphilum]